MRDITITVPKLFDWQKEFLERTERFKIAVCSRQIGKSTLAKRLAIKALLEGKKICYITPVFTQTLEVFRSLRTTLEDITSYISTPKEIHTVTKGVIKFRSADSPDSLRSDNFDLVILDEAAFIDESIMKVVRPFIAVRKGSIYLFSTPNGHNWLFNLWTTVESDPSWYRCSHPWTASPLLDEAEMQQHRDRLTPQEFNQEFLANFVSMTGSLFQAEWMKDIFIAEFPMDCPRIVISTDLSLGHLKSDYQVICALGIKAQTFYVDIEAMRCDVSTFCQRVKDKYDFYKAESIGIETNALQWLTADAIERLFPIPPFIQQINNKVKKEIRIGRLAGLLEKGQIKVVNNRGGQLLYQQLLDYPQAEFDDLPDALEMGWRQLLYS